MGKVKRLELWWQLYLYVTSGSGLRKKTSDHFMCVWVYHLYGRRDVTKPTFALRNFTNAPNKHPSFCCEAASWYLPQTKTVPSVSQPKPLYLPTSCWDHHLLESQPGAVILARGNLTRRAHGICQKLSDRQNLKIKQASSSRANSTPHAIKTTNFPIVQLNLILHYDNSNKGPKHIRTEVL
jgi:hypothetical protein